MAKPKYLFADTLNRLVRNRNVRRGQILVLAVVIFFLFFLVATVLVDVYTLFEARNWGYRVAQQAALAGASWTATKWQIYQPTATADPMVNTPTPGAPGCIDPARIELDHDDAYESAEDMLNAEMGARGLVHLVDYWYEIDVHEQFNGDTTVNWPPPPVRLGVASLDWTTDNPAVGVYIRFHVDTFLLSAIGITPGEIHVFAAAEAAQPPACP